MRNTVVENCVIEPASIDEDHIHVVAAIIRNPAYRQKFLIAQRLKGKHLENYWEFPGGKLEAGESRWCGLQRELEEEINISATGGSPYLRVYYRYPERNVLLDTWTVDSYRGEIIAREQQAIAWIGIDEAENYRFPPADIPVLESIKGDSILNSL